MGSAVTGKGQTIAILIDTFPTAADLKAFWKLNKLKTKISQVTMINVNNATLPPQEGEETLDAQWTSGIAPGAKIRIYASGTLQFTDLDRALDRIISDLASQPDDAAIVDQPRPRRNLHGAGRDQRAVAEIPQAGGGRRQCLRRQRRCRLQPRRHRPQFGRPDPGRVRILRHQCHRRRRHDAEPEARRQRAERAWLGRQRRRKKRTIYPAGLAERAGCPRRQPAAGAGCRRSRPTRTPAPA